jgi:hypothetical protein
MKRITIIIASMLLIITSATVTASAKDASSKDLRITKRYRYTQPILFVERGVEFLIFPNGEFDFNTEIVDGPFNNDFYFRNQNSRRSSVNVTYGAPGNRMRYARPGVLLLHDRFGKVRRIGNLFLNYDRYGRIKRVGSVYMQYRHGKLKRVGGLSIQYNRFGDMIGTHGFVNHSNQGCGACGASGCTADHFDDSWFDNDWNEFDDDYYYYRKGDKKLKRKKVKKRKRSRY